MAFEHRNRLIGDRYRLLEVLGTGGFGRVWKAYDLWLHIDVALKELRLPEAVSSGERADRLERAEREARNAARLRDHPNIVTVHDVVIQDGVPWIVMQLVEGSSLHEHLRRGPLPEERVVDIAAALLDALGTAHRAGVVHRDVKPANIMLAADGGVLLTDFGIAVHHTDNTLTPSGMIIGSAEYMAPERARGEAGEAASDLFSLGVTLYHAVEGVSPFLRDNPLGSLHAVAYDEAPAMERAERLGPLVEGLLEKDPGDRPDASGGLELLNAAPTDRLAGRPAGGPAVPPGPAGPAGPSTTTSNWAVWATVLALAAALTVGLYHWNQGFANFATEHLKMADDAWSAKQGDCLHHDTRPGVDDPWVQVPCFSAAADHTVVLPSVYTEQGCNRSGGTVIRGSGGSGTSVLCVASKSSGAAPAPGPTDDPVVPPSPGPAVATPNPISPKPTTPVVTVNPTTRTPSPVFDPTSLDRRSTDTTPLTPAGLLPASFTDSRNVRYTRKASGTHPCVRDSQDEAVRRVLRASGCDIVVTGSYVDEANEILVSVWVVPMADKATAQTAYDALDDSSSGDWGLWCPQEGAGSQLCDDRDISRVTDSGFRGLQHRYLVHTRALFINFSEDSGGTPRVKAAADAAVSEAGPANNRR
ncbi:protein kinase [Kitasatospora sp. NPDC058170]|uniref:serine/threonine-protein kinase n=1 Tax=Kitasatospora sp. NPDC058170 TaxID=3346364 RepID=UPI0036D8C3E3